MAVQMVDLALSPEEAKLGGPSVVTDSEAPRYPWGLTLTLDEKTLEKLKVDHSDWSVGDIFHLHAIARVTSVSEHENQNGNSCNVGLQIVAMGAESEDAENEENEEAEPSLERHGYLRYGK